MPARRFSKAAQYFIPRSAERLAHAADHVNAGIRGSRFDALHVTPINFRQPRKIILRQSTLHSQAVNVFAKNGARRLTHSTNVRHSEETGSGLIIAFSLSAPQISGIVMHCVAEQHEERKPRTRNKERTP